MGPGYGKRIWHTAATPTDYTAADTNTATATANTATTDGQLQRSSVRCTKRARVTTAWLFTIQLVGDVNSFPQDMLTKEEEEYIIGTGKWIWFAIKHTLSDLAFLSDNRWYLTKHWDPSAACLVLAFRIQSPFTHTWKRCTIPPE